MRHRYTVSIQWMEPREKTGAFSSKTNDWTGARQSAKAILSPPSGQMMAQQYGSALSDVTTITLPRKTPISVGCGVWLHDTQTAAPWGIVLAVRTYPRHTEADVQRSVMHP